MLHVKTNAIGPKIKLLHCILVKPTKQVVKGRLHMDSKSIEIENYRPELIV